MSDVEKKKWISQLKCWTMNTFGDESAVKGRQLLSIDQCAASVFIAVARSPRGRASGLFARRRKCRRGPGSNISIGRKRSIQACVNYRKFQLCGNLRFVEVRTTS